MGTIVIRYAAMILDYFAALILLLILVCCLLEKSKTVLLRLYIRMALSCAAALLLEAVSFSLSLFWAERMETDGTQLLLSAVAVAFGYVLAFSYACYVANLVGLKRRSCRLILRFLVGTGIAAMFCLILGICSGWYFSIRDGVFLPGRYFGATFAYDILACLAGIFLVLRSGRALNKRDVVALLSLPVLIFLSAVQQYSSFKILFGLFLMSAVSLVIIYLMIQTDRNNRTIAQEKQLMDMNITMMLSQIQPHFLYNSLSSIRRMIRKDPAVAEAAVENFSLYLRKNLESMSRVEPVPFTTELAHVEEYLYLEKLRFGERLRVEYDIACDEFTLPVLTLQPIVENAVKHGVLKREEGGCVRISTRRQEGTVILTVEDDGVGFLPESVGSDDRLHIGLKNAENRIRMQSRGTLEIESTVDMGTTVTVRLPLI